MVKSEQGDFEEYEMCLPIYSNCILLETIEKRLGLHKPPLRMNSVNNVPAVAQPADKTLAFDLQDGQRIDLAAEIAPGITRHHALHYASEAIVCRCPCNDQMWSNYCAGSRHFSAYPQPFFGFAKGLQWF